MRHEALIIGVDLGGTKVLAGAVDETGHVVDKERDVTHAEEGTERVIGRTARVIQSLLQRLGGRPVEAVCVGVPGSVDAPRGVVDRAPNLDWNDVPLAGILSPLVGLPVLLDNDVRAAAIGEHLLGAGAGTRSMIAVWVGTGIGGGLILDGKPYQGGRGAAGELGHTIVLAKGPRCTCGNRGCIEALASRTAMERDLRAAVAKGARSDIIKQMKKKGRDQLTSSLIVRALDDEDRAMTKVYARAQRYLGLFSASLINIFDPEAIVFGGGLAERLGERLVGPIRDVAYRHALNQRDLDRVRIVSGALGEDAPVVGAAEIARRRLHPVAPASLLSTSH